MRRFSGKVIVDGDWGADEMQVMAVLLAHDIEIAGICSVFGNAPHDQVLKNALKTLFFLKAGNISCYPGAKGPIDMPMLEGDGAHGDDGLGGTSLPESPLSAVNIQASDFILSTLRKEPAHSVILIATGPLTNIAKALIQDPETMARVKKIAIMGGCTKEIAAHDRPMRQGNITPFAEFNFYMAAQDAKTVLQSGLPITLFPMNCTQQLSFTPERGDALMQTLPVETARLIASMMNAPRELDRMKFNADPFMHDIHTALGVLYPEEYSGDRGMVDVTTEGSHLGRSVFTRNSTGHIDVMEQIRDPDRLFDIYRQSLERIYNTPSI